MLLKAIEDKRVLQVGDKCKATSSLSPGPSATCCQEQTERWDRLAVFALLAWLWFILPAHARQGMARPGRQTHR
jgi:hypothetical protein